MTGHLDDNTLAELSVGALEGAALAQAHAHLDACAPCRQLLAAAAGTRAPEAASPRTETDPSPGPASNDSTGPHTLPPGSRLGRFVVVRALGAGAMGAVYEASDPELQRPVAVKLLRKDIFRSAPGLLNAEARLAREARAMARLTHPSVVTIYDVGSAHGQLFIAMELVKGQTLRQWLRTPRSLESRLRILHEAGMGLAAAHEAGLVHRDFKPDNVLVSEDGRARVTDFGLVVAEVERPAPQETTSQPAAELPGLRDSDSLDTLTRSGTVLGTPLYMSPEQLTLDEVGPLSDQFSFAVTLHEAVYGARPFTAKSLGELARTVSVKDAAEQRVPRSGAPRWLRTLIVRALSTEPAERFPTMVALLAELRRGMQSRRRRTMAVGAAVLVALVTVWVGARAALRREALCSDGAAQLAPVRALTHGPQLAAALQRANPSLGAKALPVIQRGVEDYAAQWEAAYVDACRARRVTHTQTEQQLGLRMDCLSQRKRALETLTTTLVSTELDDGTLRSVPGALEALPMVSACADVDALGRGSVPVRDVTQKAAVEAVRGRIAEAQALMTLGRSRDAKSKLAGIEEAARQTGYEPVVGEALVEKATVAGWLSETDKGDSEAQEALLIAERHRDDHLAFAAERLHFSYLVVHHQTEEAEKLYPLLEAKWVRAGSAPAEHERVIYLLAGLRMMEGKQAEAAVLYRQSAALASQLHGPTSAAAGKSYSNLAGVLIALERFPEAVDAAERALACAKSQGLSRNQELARAYLNEGAALSGIEGRYDDSARATAEAVRLYEEVSTPLSDAMYRQALGNLAADFAHQGKVDAAVKLYRRVLDVFLTQGEDGRVDSLFTSTQLGEVLLNAGRLNEAAKELRDALRRVEGLKVPPDQLALVQHTLALCEFLLGNRPLALKWSREAALKMNAQDSSALDLAANRYVYDASRGADRATLAADWMQVQAAKQKLRSGMSEWVGQLEQAEAKGRRRAR